MLIYFDSATRERLFANFARHAHEDGWMVLGRSDCYRGTTDWSPQKVAAATVYRRINDRR